MPRICAFTLLGLVRRYVAARVTQVCTVALAADMLDVHRLTRTRARHSARRYLRPATQYKLPLPSAASEGEECS